VSNFFKQKKDGSQEKKSKAIQLLLICVTGIRIYGRGMFYG